MFEYESDDFDPTLDENADAVPMKRYRQVWAQLKAAERQADEWKTKASTAGSDAQKVIATLEQTLAERDTAIAQMRVDHGFESALLKDGIDDAETADFLRYKYAQVPAPEGGAKPSVLDWFTEYKGTKPSILARFQKDPQKQPAPSGITPTLPQSKPPVQETKAPAPPPKPPAVDGTNGTRVKSDPLPAAGISPQQFARMSKEERDAYGGTMGLLGQLLPGAQNDPA